ncbi:MAG: hypothetical protein OEW60_03525 [Thiovulaceae bacterium]|nr:hypothetical protein [Sulfurimonadaceae bacterium]
MYNVTIENPCRCFFKNALPESQTFPTMEAAKAEAESLHKLMQDTFCKKHSFYLMPTSNGYTISIRES